MLHAVWCMVHSACAMWLWRLFLRMTTAVSWRGRPAADNDTKRTLSILKKELVQIVKCATADAAQCCLSREESARLLSLFHPRNVHASSSFSSYTVNKTHLYVALSHDAGSPPKPWDDIVHEAVHLLTHLVNHEVGHGPLFWTIKERMVRAMFERATPDLYMARRMVAARRIQRAWRECVSNPVFHVCKNRLMSEFDRFHAEVGDHRSFES